MIRFSLLTLNLWNINQPCLERMKEIVKFINIEKPDVLLLQEVSLWNDVTQSEFIKKNTYFINNHYSQEGFWKGREEGLAVLTKKTSEELFSIELTEGPNDMPRILQRVLLTYYKNGIKKMILIGNTHLAYHQNAKKIRIKQTSEILVSLAKSYKKNNIPIILCGDFNDVPNSPVIEMILNNHEIDFRDIWDIKNKRNFGYTFSTENPWALSNLNPNRRIDYIFISKTINLISTNIVFTKNDGYNYVSDHYGLLVTLEVL